MPICNAVNKTVTVKPHRYFFSNNNTIPARVAGTKANVSICVSWPATVAIGVKLLKAKANAPNIDAHGRSFKTDKRKYILIHIKKKKLMGLGNQSVKIFVISPKGFHG